MGTGRRLRDIPLSRLDRVNRSLNLAIGLVKNSPSQSVFLQAEYSYRTLQVFSVDQRVSSAEKRNRESGGVFRPLVHDPPERGLQSA